MARFRVAACALAVLTLAACGSDAKKERRDAVNGYLAATRQAQVDLTGHVGQIDAALAGFSLRSPTVKEERALRDARRLVSTAIVRVRAVDAPPDARKLDGLLLRRLGLQRDLLDELVVTSGDARRLTRSVPRLQAASARLRSDFAAIGAQKVPQGGSPDVLQRYGAAFGRYGAALRPVAPTVAPSTRPSLLTPLLSSEHEGLVRSVALSTRIRAALARHDVAQANRDVHTLLTIAATLNDLETQKAEAAAARAYNAKIRRITALGTEISAEHARLVRLVG